MYDHIFYPTFEERFIEEDRDAVDFLRMQLSVDRNRPFPPQEFQLGQFIADHDGHSRRPSSPLPFFGFPELDCRRGSSTSTRERRKGKTRVHGPTGKNGKIPALWVCQSNGTLQGTSVEALTKPVIDIFCLSIHYFSHLKFYGLSPVICVAGGGVRVMIFYFKKYSSA
jgi:hypothetical protein